jgi:predicted Abi (CAAX) family protease
VLDAADAAHYVRRRCWPELVARKGSTLSTRLSDARWAVGDRALVAHVYGGIGGRGGERAAAGPIYFGHFAYGFADVVADRLAGEARFDITYLQVYTHNTDGLIAGRLHWSRYIADRQFGWLGARPTCDVLLRETSAALLDTLELHLDAMTARYRIGDGTGGTYVGVANNCAQDANQALFAALRDLDPSTEAALCADLRRQLEPFGRPRRDWSDNAFDLGTTMQTNPLQQIRTGLGSWRVMLPRMAADTIVGAFLRHGADAWVLGTDQVHDRPDLRPVVPLRV